MNCFCCWDHRFTSEGNWPQTQVVLKNFQGANNENQQHVFSSFPAAWIFLSASQDPRLAHLRRSLVADMSTSSFHLKTNLTLSGRPPIQPGDKICGGAVIGELGDQIMVSTFHSPSLSLLLVLCLSFVCLIVLCLSVIKLVITTNHLSIIM